MQITQACGSLSINMYDNVIIFLSVKKITKSNYNTYMIISYN